MGKTYLTATQAKEKATNPERLINSMFRAIDEQSGYGICSMEQCWDNLTDEAIDKIVNTFVDKGYTVNWKKEETESGILDVSNISVTFRISWANPVV